MPDHVSDQCIRNGCGDAKKFGGLCLDCWVEWDALKQDMWMSFLKFLKPPTCEEPMHDHSDGCPDPDCLVYKPRAPGG